MNKIYKLLIGMIFSISAITNAQTPCVNNIYSLSVSTSSSRSGGVSLYGSTISGATYIFTSPTTDATNYNPTGITQACYWLDNTTMSGAAKHCESASPYDFAGTSSNISIANSWDTTALANGTHTITQQITKSAGGTESYTATFTINNTIAPPPPTPSGAAFYSSTSFINTPLNNPVVDPNSASMVQNGLTQYASKAHLSAGAYGIALCLAKPTDPVATVKCNTYSSSTCAVGSSIKFPIPQGCTPPTGTDHNTAVIYPTQDGSAYAGKELDMWVASGSGTSWSAGVANVTPNIPSGWGTCCTPVGCHCTGGTASGIDFAAGAVRPEEIKAGVIPHAIMVLSQTIGNGIACPGTHTDNGGSGIPEGGHFFLPKSYNIDAQTWPAWIKTIAHALQNYGGYIVDFTGGGLQVEGFTDTNAVINGGITWASLGVPVDTTGSLAVIPWNQMQVEQVKWCTNTATHKPVKHKHLNKRGKNNE